MTLTSRRAVHAACAQVASTCACFAIRRAARAATQLYDEVLHASGLRVTQLSLLVSFALAGSVSITVLGEKLLMDRTTMTRNLKPLERQGLIGIGPGRDRRYRVVRLTARGQRSEGCGACGNVGEDVELDRRLERRRALIAGKRIPEERNIGFVNVHAPF